MSRYGTEEIQKEMMLKDTIARINLIMAELNMLQNDIEELLDGNLEFEVME